MIAQLDSLYVRIRPWKLWSRLVSYALFEGRPLTTRGRWINPIVFALFAMWKRIPKIRQVKRPVFILGTGRSGTTILGLVLSMHRQIGFLNEPKALWHSLYAQEDLIGSYSRETARYRLTAADVTPKLQSAAHRIFGAYLFSTFSRRLVDKYPELIFRVPFVKAVFPDAQFIFLVRNGWDTCHSIDQWSERLGQQAENGEVHDWWGVNRRKWNLLIEQIIPEHSDLAPFAGEMRSWSSDVDMAAVEWIVTMREGLRQVERFPDSVLRVDYELLCKDPEKILRGVAEFCGLNNDPKFLEYAASVLKPVRAKPPFKLHPAIEMPFLETMRNLGY